MGEITQNKVAATLAALFRDHRVVIWQDEKSECREQFESFSRTTGVPAGICCVHYAHRQFSLKRRILRTEREKKFLVYTAGPIPEPAEDPWLDLRLAAQVFVADRCDLWCLELGLERRDGREFLQRYADFFADKSRRARFKKFLPATTERSAWENLLLGLCLCPEHPQAEFEEQVRALIADTPPEAATGEPDAAPPKYALLAACGLVAIFWQRVATIYGYRPLKPSLPDLVCTLFRLADDDRSLPKLETRDAGYQLNAPAKDFVRRWQNDRQHGADFKTWSRWVADHFQVAARCVNMSLQDLEDAWCFDEYDLQTVSLLRAGIEHRTLSGTDVEKIIRRRRGGFWFASWEAAYAALQSAATYLTLSTEFHARIEHAGPHVFADVSSACAEYTERWYRLDQLYRQFHGLKDNTITDNHLDGLAKTVEDDYTGFFLPEINDAYQRVYRGYRQPAPGQPCPQDRFFATYVADALRRRSGPQGPRVAVIISDALRYEIGEELTRQIKEKEPRADKEATECSAMLGMVPGYTQLGMAALLPHQPGTLTLAADCSVRIAGRSTQGKETRQEQLAVGCREQNLDVTVRCDKAEDLHAHDLNTDQLRARFQGVQLLYLYHNEVDQTGGNKAKKADAVFQTATSTINSLLLIVRKLNNANFSRILITADHGFLYRCTPLPERDFCSAAPTGEVSSPERRFALGSDLPPQDGYLTFPAAQLGLAGGLTVKIPGGCRRMRRSGSDGRFVHGGVTLQEQLLPLIEVQFKKKDTTRGVDILTETPSGKLLTSNLLTLTLQQAEVVGDEVKPVTLRLVLRRARDGQEISTAQKLTFDARSTEDPAYSQQARLLVNSDLVLEHGEKVLLCLDRPGAGAGMYMQDPDPQVLHAALSFARDDFDLS